MAADVTVAPTLGHAVLLTQGGVGASPGYDAIDLRRMVQAANGGQEGVYDSTGWKVRERAAGPNMTVEVDANVGIAQVKGESVTHQGSYVVAPHSAVITLDVATAHSTNPRVDMVILHVRDNTHDALGANDARVRILSGTATSGATLDNLNGQASLPSNAVRLADVLVPAADTTISNAQIRDRRPWSRGAFDLYRRTGSDYSAITTTSLALLDSTNLNRRIECAGVPLRVLLQGFAFNGTADAAIGLKLRVDGADEGPTFFHYSNVVSAQESGNLISWTFVPTAGSHLMAIYVRVTGGSGTVSANATDPLALTIEELVRQNANNT